jgi:hypothetical protein
MGSGPPTFLAGLAVPREGLGQGLMGQCQELNELLCVQGQEGDLVPGELWQVQPLILLSDGETEA